MVKWIITTREGTPMPVPQPEEVIELAAELKEARSRVAELESRWNAFFMPSSAQETMPTPAFMYLKPRIIAFLNERPDIAFNVASVSKALNASENSVGPYLSDLAKVGKIERRDRGLYGALRPKTAEDIFK